MATQNNIEQQLMDLLVTKNFQPEMKDKNGQDARDTADAKLLTFDYVGASGKNYGTMVIVLDQDNDLKIMYGDNLGRTMVGDDKDEFFDFIVQVNQIANRNRWTHTVTDLSKLKYVQQGLAAIQEGLFEGYYGTRKISYTGEPTEARLMIKHNHVLGENDKRYRYVESLYIETVDSERFKLGFKNLAGGRAMLEHVRQGGKPYDVRGNHITEMVGEIAVLSRFNRASAGRVMEGVTAELITEAQHYYKSLREDIKRMGNSRGYAKYFESWHPAVIAEQEGLVEDIKTMFIEQTLDARIEAALPVLARLQQGKAMKEAEIFENWANQVVEGTWAMPETPEAKDKLATLLMSELPVGPDATNATEQLYDVFGDDELFDNLAELAREDADADARPVIIARMEELGMEVPDITGSAQDDQAAAPAPDEMAPDAMAPVSEGDNLATFEAGGCNMTAEGEHCPEHGLMECGGMYEGQLDSPGEQDSPVAQAIIRRILMQRTDLLAKHGPEKVGAAVDEVADFVGDVDEIGSSDVSGWVRHVEQMLGNMDQGMAEGQLDEGAIETITALVKKIPGIGKYYQMAQQYKPQLIEILKTSKSGKEVKQKMEQLVAQQSAPVAESGMLKQLGGLAVGGGSILSTMWMNAMGLIDGVLAKAAAGEVGGAIASGSILGLIPVTLMLFAAMLMFKGSNQSSDEKAQAFQAQRSGMQEANDDPINYNAAITGSYYESKTDPLARIKSLALRK